MTPTLLNNRYRVLQTLGSGGFGNTFLAEDTHMPSQRRCAIKQLKPVTHDPQAYQMVKERFQREAAVLEELGEGHPQIPRLYAYFSEAGEFYLVQEYIEGDTLTKKVERGGAFGETEVKEVLVSLLPVLEYVHSRRMVHRDIKPDNIIWRKRDGLPVLIDFGAVKEAMTTVVNAPGQSAESIMIGTPGYMPSEQATGRPTYASDLYSLGLTAVFLLTGKIPQELKVDDRTGEFLWRQHAPHLHSNLAGVIDKAIRFHPGDRFPTAREMLDALQSNPAVSGLNTVAVAPKGVPQPPNNLTPTAINPRQTVPASPTPAQQGNAQKPWIIVGLVAGGLLLAAVAISSLLNRSPESSSSVSSSTQPDLEEPTAEQLPSPTPDSAPIPTPAAPPPTPTPDYSPSPEPPTAETPLVQIPPQPSETITPSPILPESPSQPSTPVPSPQPTEASTPEPIQFPSPPSANTNPNPNPPSSIPGFAPGTQKSAIASELGEPTKVSRGLWANTQAVLYEDYVPGQVSLGYLFDRSSGRLRQSEASFDASVDMETLSQTLNQMLNNNASADIRQGLESVYQRQSNRYTFVSGRGNRLKGIVERNSRDRIYVAVWEADLH